MQNNQRADTPNYLQEKTLIFGPVVNVFIKSMNVYKIMPVPKIYLYNIFTQSTA